MSKGGWRSARMGEHPRAWLVWVHDGLDLTRPGNPLPTLELTVTFDSEEQR